jgi:nicotinate-nucleotide adenylyltransferase
MTEPGRIGILGGTFDPFHLGHLALARAARTTLQLDEVRIVPSNVPPHRLAPGASSYHRFAMAALGIAGEPGLVLDDIEMALDGPSFTTTTLARFHDKGFTLRKFSSSSEPTPSQKLPRGATIPACWTRRTSS